MNIKTIEAKAVSGDVNAQCESGIFYGGSSNPSPIKYLFWLKTAAKNGSGKAQYLLGKEFIKGTIVSANVPVGLELLVKASSQNIAEANVEIGKIYIYGLGVDKDFRIADKYIFPVLESVLDIQLIYDIGLAFYSEENCTMDTSHAAEYFKRSAVLNHAQSQYLLGKILSKSSDVMEVSIESLYWLGEAAQNGVADAAFLKAELMCYNSSVMFELEEVRKCYELSANSGSVAGIRKLILLSDDDNAHHWMEKYMNTTEIIKKTYNNTCHIDSSLVEIDTSFLDIEKVYDWYEWLMDEYSFDVDSAICLYNKLNESHVNSLRNTNLKIQSLFFAADEGHLPSQMNLADLLAVRGDTFTDSDGRSDVQIAAHYYEVAADSNSTEAQYKLAKLIYDNINSNYEGFTIDAAIEWCEAADENNHKDAKELLVNLYFDKSSRIVNSFAERIFDIATEGEDVDGMGEEGRRESEKWKNKAFQLENFIKKS